ncbi:MAG TPA: hypothetical protein VKZ55_04450 [Microthrixaceae bacterium]|nr:hypothetical protein [Microthrixaceae bacterium]
MTSIGHTRCPLCRPADTDEEQQSLRDYIARELGIDDEDEEGEA